MRLPRRRRCGPARWRRSRRSSPRRCSGAIATRSGGAQPATTPASPHLRMARFPLARTLVATQMQRRWAARDAPRPPRERASQRPRQGRPRALAGMRATRHQPTARAESVAGGVRAQHEKLAPSPQPQANRRCERAPTAGTPDALPHSCNLSRASSRSRPCTHGQARPRQQAPRACVARYSLYVLSLGVAPQFGEGRCGCKLVVRWGRGVSI